MTTDVAPPDRFAAKRAQLLGALRGRVLEVGGGSGPSLEHYEPAVRLVFTEPGLLDLEAAQSRETRPDSADFAQALLPALPFAGASFDAVVVMRVLCSVPDLAEAVAELRRVLRPGGTLVFMEHVRSPNRVLGLGQRVIARPWRRYWGCWPHRDVVGALGEAGFSVEWLDRFQWGPPPVRPRVYGVARLAAPGSVE